MKILAIVVSLLAVNTALATPKSIRSALSEIEQFYKELQKSDIVEKHYWVGFSQGTQATALLKNSSVCNQPKGFLKSSLTEVLFNIERHTNVAIELGFYGSPDEVLINQRQDQAMEQLSLVLKNKELALCVDDTVPSYSDGHEKYFVRVSGRLMFVFEVGYPD